MRWQRVHLRSVDSTNLYARSLDFSHVVVSADYQSAGRGQGSNTWESEAGKNLLFSLKLSPANLLAQQQFVLSMAGALAIRAALGEYGEGFTVKWPNDIYYEDYKISGTLIETTIIGKRIQDCIFGVGINVNQQVFTSAPNPIALCQIVERELDREELLSSILEKFEEYYRVVEKGDYALLFNEYNAYLYRRKGFFPYIDKGGRFEAQVVRVETNGRLVLQDKEGAQRSYESKELTFVV